MSAQLWSVLQDLQSISPEDKVRGWKGQEQTKHLEDQQTPRNKPIGQKDLSIY